MLSTCYCVFSFVSFDVACVNPIFVAKRTILNRLRFSHLSPTFWGPALCERQSWVDELQQYAGYFATKVGFHKSEGGKD